MLSTRNLLGAKSFRAERLDSLVTVYYGRESKEVVGSLIKGVSGFVAQTLERHPGFRIEIRGGRIKLRHLFTAKIWDVPEGPEGTKTKIYSVLREAAEASQAEVEFDLVGS